jgi:hypothetical protein
MTTVKKTQGAAAAPKSQGIMMPTHEQLVNTYRSIAMSAEKHHTAKKLAHAPAGFSKAPSYNITAPGLMGVGKTAYVIKGEIYVKTQVVSPTAKPSWEKIGPAPMF